MGEIDRAIVSPSLADTWTKPIFHSKPPMTGSMDVHGSADASRAFATAFHLLS
jgi:hypothetical protein